MGKNNIILDHDPFSDDRLPNSLVALAYCLFGILSLIIVSTIIIGFVSFFVLLQGMVKTILVVKICICFSYWLFMCLIPLIGFYFVITFPTNVIFIIQYLNVEATVGIWIIFILFFIFNIGVSFLTTSVQFLIIREEYEDQKLRKKNKRLTILILICSVIIGIIFIFISDTVFVLLINFLNGL